MAQIFTALLLTSGIGTALALILTLLKPITRKVFSGGWHYYMWLVVLLVMVLPIRLNLPEKPVTTPPISETVTDNQVENTETHIINTQPEQIIQEQPEMISVVQTIKDFLINNLKLFSFIWLIGAVLLFLIKIISYLIFLIKIHRHLELISCPEVKSYTNRKIRTRVSDTICSPLMIGIIRPTLLLPKTNITPEQLHNVLAHEMTHLKRNDILYKWFVIIVKCIHWFNPVIYFVSKQINIDCEISCDLAVVKEMDEQQEKGYVETILSLLTHNNSKSIPLTTGMTGNKETLRRRFTMIKKKIKVSKKVAIISGVLAVLILVTTLFASGILNGTFLKTYVENQTEISAYIKEIKDNVIVLDIVEYITREDTERVKELKLSELDMPNGYYIYNSEVELEEFILTETTTYGFIDWKNDFVEEGEDREFYTTNRSEFIKYIDSYENSQPKMPFFIGIVGDKVISITEKPMM